MLKLTFQIVATASVAAAAPQLSFAADHEDVLLQRHVFGSLNVEKGRYIDIGAGHSYYASNTKLFHMKGWNGVVVEPMAASIRTHWADREGDVVLRSAVSTVAMERYSEGVLTTTLGDICKKYFDNSVDLLSIRAERHELAVLSSGNLTLCRPKAIIIQIQSNKVEVERHLLGQGYRVFASVGLNSIFLPQESPVAVSPSQLLALKATQQVSGVLREAAKQGLLNVLREERGEFAEQNLKDCWGEGLKAECRSTLFNSVFLREGTGYYTYTCGSGAKVVVVGNTQPVLGFRNCVPGDFGKYVVGFDLVNVAGAVSQSLTLKDGGSVLYYNFTHQASGFQFVDLSTKFKSNVGVLYRHPTVSSVSGVGGAPPLDFRTLIELTIGSIIAGCVAVFYHCQRRGVKTPTSPRCVPEDEDC